ncbi:MAG: hypothetical protein E7310_09015 [Clostridiales bacterium]|nr:hypothetical protein [Clostridiales bacterium]
MKNRKLIELIKYEVEKSVKTKWFIILNIVLLLGCIILNNMSEITKFTDMFSDEIYIDIVDNENLMYDDLVSAFSDEEYKDRVIVKRIEEFKYDEETYESNAATIEVLASEENGLNVKITTLEELNEDYYKVIEDVVIKNRNELLVNKIGVDEEKMEFLMSEPVIEEVIAGIDTEDLETKSTIQFISAYANLIILFLLMKNVQTQFMQEKISKSSEYVLTNINEKSYLLLKTFTVIIVFIIQAILLISYYLVGAVINQLINIGTLTIESTDILGINMDIVKMIGIQLILSVCSIFIQCLIQAAISSRTGNPKDGTNAMTILIVLNFAIYMYAASYGVGMNLSGNINSVLSVIPILSTYLIPVMIMYNSANTIQIVLAILLDILLIPITIKKCSKVVKNGILGHDTKEEV